MGQKQIVMMVIVRNHKIEIMKLEIYRDNKKIKVKKYKKITEPKVMDIDFTSIKSLVGNKIILEMLFQQTKNELIYGKESWDRIRY